MEKIIVRNRLRDNGSEVEVLEEFYGPNATKQSILLKYGYQKIMKDIFHEEIESDCLEQTSLFKHYLEAVESKKDNLYFCFMYRLNKEFVLNLTETINLCILSSELEKGGVGAQLVPWKYIESSKFMGYTKWGTKEEIIKDFMLLNIIDFMEKYKY